MLKLAGYEAFTRHAPQGVEDTIVGYAFVAQLEQEALFRWEN